MSTTIEKIRSLVQDKPQAFQETTTLELEQTSFQLKYFPTNGDVIITGDVDDPTIDEETGKLTWSSAPGEHEIVIDYQTVLLSDDTIQDFIDIQDETNDSDNIFLIAALALDAMASNQALLLKKITMLDLNTDGPALAKALREHAKTLRDTVNNPAYQEPYFDFVEQINDTPGLEEKLVKDLMREDG